MDQFEETADMSDRHPRCGTRANLLRGSILALALGLSCMGQANAQSMGLPPAVGGGAGNPQGVQMPSVLSPQPQSAPPEDNAPAAQSSAPLAASSSSCQDDIGKLAQKRMASIEQLNKIAKANKGKLDPIAACPKFNSLISVEREFEAYMVKNKDWCNIPDDVIENVKQGAAKDAAVGKQACAIAAQVRKAQKQQAAGGGGLGQPPAPRLPAGPL
jgi:hypothetical protein